MADYTDIVSGWVNLLEQAPSPYTPPTDMANLLPRAIEYATNRICRDMILLAQRQSQSINFTTGSRSLDLSSLNPTCLVVEGVAAITPVNTAPAAGTRWQYDPVSLDTVDFVWPTEATTGAPNTSDSRGWSLKDDHTVVVYPTPDNSYTCEITGLFALAYINASSPTSNYITNTYPELFLAAGMIFWAGFQRDYGSQSEDSRLAQSWENQYGLLLSKAQDEEKRRRLLVPADGSMTRSPAPSPPPSQGS